MQVCGFSGTNDNRQLLPFSVKAEHPAHAGTRGTDGKMVGLLATPGKCTYRRLSDDAAAVPLRLGAGGAGATAAHGKGGDPAKGAAASAYHGKRLLDAVVQLGVHALIDAGAA